MNFKGKNKISAFTLIELIVVIAVIWVIALWVTRIDFNRVSDQQRIDIFTNEVASKIETVRNNALIWKWVWVNVETPDSWEIIASNTWSGSVQTSYDVGGTLTVSNEYSVTPNDLYEITDLNCLQLDDTTESITWDIVIDIDGNDMTLSGCSDDNYKILEITTQYKNLSKTVRVNTLSWLVEVD